MINFKPKEQIDINTVDLELVCKYCRGLYVGKSKTNLQAHVRAHHETQHILGSSGSFLPTEITPDIMREIMANINKLNESNSTFFPNIRDSNSQNPDSPSQNSSNHDNDDSIKDFDDHSDNFKPDEHNEYFEGPIEGEGPMEFDESNSNVKQEYTKSAEEIQQSMILDFDPRDIANVGDYATMEDSSKKLYIRHWLEFCNAYR